MGLPKSGENSTFNYLINLINLLFDFLINDIKIYRVKVIWAKDGDSWTTQGWEINFFRQNIGMFERLCTQTYTVKINQWHVIVSNNNGIAVPWS